jgi:hypothetical protein
MNGYRADGLISLICMIAGTAICFGVWVGTGWAGVALLFWAALLMWANS